jgi:hypothetical protein
MQFDECENNAQAAAAAGRAAPPLTPDRMSMKKQKKEKKEPSAKAKPAASLRAQTKRSMVDTLCQDPADAEAWMHFLNQIEVRWLVPRTSKTRESLR